MLERLCTALLDPQMIPPDWLTAGDRLVNGLGLGLAAALGAVLLFWGQPLFRLWMALSGGYVGFVAARFVLNWIQVPAGQRWMVTLGLTLAGVALFASLLRTCTVIAGFAAGAAIAMSFVQPVAAEILGVSSLLVCGIAGAVTAAFAARFFTRAAAAVCGAWLLVRALWLAAGRLPFLSGRFPAVQTNAQPIWLCIPMILLAIWGIRSQQRRSRRARG